eukprot:2290313-Pyramimonas_sp.AAC.1
MVVGHNREHLLGISPNPNRSTVVLGIILAMFTAVAWTNKGRGTNSAVTRVRSPPRMHDDHGP